MRPNGLSTPPGHVVGLVPADVIGPMGMASARMSSPSSPPSEKAPPAPVATPPPTPTWVKVFAVLGAVVLLLILGIVVANHAGFGLEHGPGRHLGGNEDRTSSAPSESTMGSGNTTAEPVLPRAQSAPRVAI